VKKKDIETIVLGLRQRLFDFEKDKSEEQTLVMSCIEKKIEKYGHVDLDECVQHVKELHELSDAAIIQHLFWLAEDLKVHFRIDGENLEPPNVKRTLLKSIEQHVTILPNKPVDDSVFQDVKRFYRKLTIGKDFGDSNDQYEFARLLAKKIKGWQVTLKSCKSDAQMPFLPYEKEINQEASLKLSDDVRKISEFYAQHIDFWKNLVQSYEVVNSDLSELIKDSNVAASFEKLKQILLSSAPCNMITEAKDLLVKMTQQCRIALLAKINDMIEATKKHLDAHGAGPDLRNKSLYCLRTTKKHIHEAKNIKRMNLCLIDAKEKFETFWDEIKINQ